jgi:hypothetical protein
MIVRQELDGSLVMITQNDHAQVAATFAAHWGNAGLARPSHRNSMIRAAMLHDFSWIEEETKPVFDPATGGCVHYLRVPSETQLAANQWTNDWVSRMDPYAGLMVARHRTGIWKARYGLMQKPSYAARALPAAVEDFIVHSHAEQAALEAGLEREGLTANYILLQIWDMFSLYICTNEVLQELVIDPVPGLGGREMRLVPGGDRRISIDPWPFDVPALTVGVRYRRLREMPYASADDFRDAYFGQPQELMGFTFLPG